ncbi:MAG: HD domain-containing protein [Clostridia bacterium]|nr:HD domain-containing protein [Clostridia bacterium]
MMRLPEYVLTLISRLEENGFEAYAVGGCVRDMLMGKEPNDYDITTNAKPEEIKKCFTDYPTILIGEKHGTVCVVSDGENVEITTYRIDGEYKDSRHPEKVSFTSSLTEDLARRDFTVNAIAYSPTGGMSDPFGGRDDINKKIIRCVGTPEKRFEEDALRILRAIRFSSVLGFEIDKDAEKSIHRRCNDLKSISAERIFSELCKLLCGENVKSVLSGFSDVISVILPELKDTVGFEQKNRHHCFDVYTHTANVVEKCPPDAELRLAALFHDAGKPACFFMGEDGEGHFYGHAEKSKELASTALARLKAPNSVKNLVCELIRVHDREIVNTKKSLRRFLAGVSEETAKRIFPLKKADNLSLSPEYHNRIEGLQETEAAMYTIMESNECVSQNQLAINGNDLIKLGLSEGRELGRVKNAILAAVIDGEVENEKNVLVAYAKRIIEQKN